MEVGIFLFLNIKNLAVDEVSKPNDKYERPYKCKESEYAEVKGFTHLGGLHRHEKEVHHKHNLNKKLFFCPHAACKCSSKNPFKRRENLKGHIRAVHSYEEPPAALLTQNALLHTTYTGSKRTRRDTKAIGETEERPDETPRAELKRLLMENKQLALEKERLI